jgi:DNA helicase-2/ATP-dependent DNA helicase PcrA
VYGGLRFFERAEIKDALAYLRLILNHQDDSAWERIINTPTRGIGEKTVETIRELARSQNLSLWQASEQAIANNLLPNKARSAVQQFMLEMEGMGARISELPLHEQVEQVILASGLIQHYEKEPGEKGQARLENLAELVTAARQFAPEEIDTSLTPLAAFLSHAVLESGEGQAEVHQDSIQLMTLHSAKGLEFQVVFLSGMEDELFPPRWAMEDLKRLEEERRLCYVGMTRAREKLYITYAESRRLYGESRMHRPSRFIREIPPQYLSEVRMKAVITRPSNNWNEFDQTTNENYRQPFKPVYPKAVSSLPYKIGQQVKHPKFGEGVILNFEGSGEQARLQIKFAREGVKWLVAAYANLVTS